MVEIQALVRVNFRAPLLMGVVIHPPAESELLK